MRELLYSVVGSLVAAFIFLAVPSVSRYFVRNDVCLDVDIATEQYGSLFISKIIARNSSQYGFDPVQFSAESSGSLLHLAIRQCGESKVLTADGTNHLSSAFSIGAGETIEMIEIDEGGSIKTEPQRLFAGKYTGMDSRGLPEKRSIRVRTAAEAQLSLYRLVAKAVGGFVILVTLGTGVLFRWKKLKRKNSNGV